MSVITFIYLILSAILTSAVSASFGMIGGVLFLTLMSLILPLNIVIPIHGIVQLVSNSSRAFFLRHHIHVSFLVFFIIGLPFGTLTTVYFLKKFQFQSLASILIVFLIFYSVFRPKKLPAILIPAWGYLLVGYGVGFLGPLVGATGPFLGPFILRDDFDKQKTVATMAAMQTIGHLIKIPTFIYLGFNFIEHWVLILLLTLAAVFGTRFGVSWLEKIPQHIFKLIFQIALLGSAIHILYKVIIK